MTANEMIDLLETHYNLWTIAAGDWDDVKIDVEWPRQIQALQEKYTRLSNRRASEEARQRAVKVLGKLHRTQSDYMKQQLNIGEVDIMGAAHTDNVILHFKTHGFYLCVAGNYNSYEGTNYYDLYEVHPVETTFINYVPV